MFFIEDLEKRTGVGKRDIYNLIRRKEFYMRFGIRKMADLEESTNNGSVSKVLTQEMFDYLLEKIESGATFRSTDYETPEMDSSFYVVDLCPNGVLEIDGVKQRRYKVGITTKELAKRESDFRVSNPEAAIVKSWKLTRAEEQVLLNYVNGNGCERIGGTEVFNVTNFDEFISKIEEFVSNAK